MSQISSMFGHIPGMGDTVETYEAAWSWGPFERYYTSAYIASTAADPTNTPTWELRVGLVMARNSSGAWVNYNPTATDGSEVAQGILPIPLRMQDVLSGNNTTKAWAICVSGGVQASKLIGLDNQARAQLANRFIFDDDFAGRAWFPWKRFNTQTANYTILASDNMTQFNNLGAGGEVDFTLPPIANGYFFGFSVQAAQILKVISNEGANIVAFNNAAATSLSFAGAGAEIGGGLRIYSNPAGTLWIAESVGNAGGTNTITIT